MAIVQYHIVSGDALAHALSVCDLEGEVMVCRECLIEGPLDGENLAEFLAVRAAFIREAYSAADYQEKAAPEFEKVFSIPAASEVNLWFGNDLFCQANMWFVASLLEEDTRVFRVFPFQNGKPIMDFSSGECGDLSMSLEQREEFGAADLKLAQDLWRAYRSNDLARLEELSKTESDCFEGLEPACRAHIERFGDDPRPQRVLREIKDSGLTEFKDIFQEFCKREPIYGFGDSQVKRLLAEMG